MLPTNTYFPFYLDKSRRMILTTKLSEFTVAERARLKFVSESSQSKLSLGATDEKEMILKHLGHFSPIIYWND